MIPSRSRSRFVGSHPLWAVITITAAVFGGVARETGQAAEDRALSPSGGAAAPPRADRLSPAAVEAGPHHRSRRALPPGRGRAGDGTATGAYIELAAGLNRWDSRLEDWQPAAALFERHREGHFLARSTQHQVILAPDLNVQSAVDLLAPDGVRFRSTILGLALIDAGSGRNVLLAELKNCRGAELSPTEVIYRDAFDGLLADVRYRIALDRFEQDVILRERIPPEVLRELGLDPSQTRLLVLTEFFDPPRPTKRIRHLHLPEGRSLADEELSFGAMRMGVGQAAPVGSDAPGIPVHKSWEVLDGRQLLIEALPYLALLSVSETLPTASRDRIESLRARVRRTAGVTAPDRTQPGAEPELRLPAPRQAWARPVGWETEEWEAAPPQRSTAQAPAPPASALLVDGVVIDYALTLTPTIVDYTFQGDTTYHISGTLSLSGTTTIEGGCVVKFAPAASACIVLDGPVNCQTAAYRPAIFTARDDDTVGEIIANSTGQPTPGYYAQPALQIMRSNQTLHDLRIAYAQTGVFFHDHSAGGNSVRHVQFVRCGTALKINGYGTFYQNLTLHNLLFHDTPQAMAGYSFNARAEHLTVCQVNRLATDTQGYLYGTQSTLALTNSLLVAVAAPGNATLTQSYCQSAGQSNEVFQTVGAGGFYLARPYARNAGTTNINPTLALELRQKTTSPPALRSGVSQTDLVFAPLVSRDQDCPDLGYHYAPLDYAVSELGIAAGRTLTLLPDTCVATFGAWGIRLHPAATLRAEGAPQRPVRVLRHSLVQEQSLPWGSAATNPVSVLGTDSDATLAPTGPSASLRFVEFLDAANSGTHLRSDISTSRFHAVLLQDCRVAGGRLELTGDVGTTVNLSNCLFDSASVSLRSKFQVRGYNNLFRNGRLELDRARDGSDWVLCDNAFHEVDLRDLGEGITHSHNAYLGSQQSRLTGVTSNNVALATFPYASGPLGGYYHSPTNLLNAGSRTAAAAGLYHHTVQTGQTKEANTLVDIGFHYVAVDGTDPTAQPQDTDRDSVADYLEDADGDGLVDATETDWRDARDLGLQIRITRPRRSSPLP